MAILLIASTYPVLSIGALLVHWVVMFLWLNIQQERNYPSCFQAQLMMLAISFPERTESTGTSIKLSFPAGSCRQKKESQREKACRENSNSTSHLFLHKNVTRKLFPRKSFGFLSKPKSADALALQLSPLSA